MVRGRSIDGLGAGAGDDDGARARSVGLIALLSLETGVESCELGNLNMGELCCRCVGGLKLRGVETRADSVEMSRCEGYLAMVDEAGLNAVGFGVVCDGDCSWSLLLLLMELELPRISAI